MRNVLERDLFGYMANIHPTLKYCWSVTCVFTRRNGTQFNYTFRSLTRTLLDPNQFVDLYNEDYEVLAAKFDTFLKNGSDCQLDKILNVGVEIYKYQPILGGSWIPTPEKYKHYHCSAQIYGPRKRTQ